MACSTAFVKVHGFREHPSGRRAEIHGWVAVSIPFCRSHEQHNMGVLNSQNSLISPSVISGGISGQESLCYIFYASRPKIVKQGDAAY